MSPGNAEDPQDPRERIMFRLHEEDEALIRFLVGQVLELIDGLPEGDPGLADLGISGNAEQPEDPVLARLFPDGYRDDPEAAGEFRRYSELSLRDAKREAAETVLKTVGTEVVLDDRQAGAWLRAINDIRLVLGTGLELAEDGDFDALDREIDDGDPRRECLELYERFSLIQESLLRIMLSEPDSLRSMLTIEQALVDQIVAHARADHPDEACGVVAGPYGSDRPERFIRMDNAERSPTFYRFDSMEQLRVWREMDDRDEEPVVIYHSHTATEAYPSRTDISYASEPGAHYVLVSTSDPERAEFRSYRIVEGEVTEEEVRIVASYDVGEA